MQGSSSVGFRILPPATTRERLDQLRALRGLRQEGWEVGCFAKVFWTMAVRLGYNDAALKEVFNCCLDDPLPQCEMEGLRILDFWRFAAYLRHRKEWTSPSQQGSVHAPAHESVSEGTGEVGTEPQLHPEPAPTSESAPVSESAPARHALPISPVMAKRAVLTFYVLAVLRAWRMLPEQPQPEHAAVPEQPQPEHAAAPEQPQPEHAAVPEQPQPEHAAVPEQPQPEHAAVPEQPQPEHAAVPEQPQPEHAAVPEQPQPEHAAVPEQPQPEHAAVPEQPQPEHAAVPEQPQPEHAAVPEQPQPEHAAVPEQPQPEHAAVPEQPQPEHAAVPEQPQPEHAAVPEQPQPEHAAVPEQPQPEHAAVPEQPQPEHAAVPEQPQPEHAAVPEQPQPEHAAVPEQPQPEHAAVPEQPQPEHAAVPESSALPDTATETVTELPALPDTATEHPWSALPPPPRPSALPPPSKPSALPPLPRPPEPLKPAWSVPPAPPWHSARNPNLREPAWSVPPAPPWHSARTPTFREPPCDNSMKITFTLFLAHLTCCFLVMDTSDILGQILSEESPDEILDHYTEDSDPTQLVRCSSWIAARNPFSISEWPKERILATLYSLNVQVPPDLNQDQLLTFLQEVNQDPQPPSTNVSSLPGSTGLKATEKRKNISNNQASPTSKKVKTSNPPQASAQQGDDRVLTALLSIQGSLSDMDNRIQTLESQRSASAPRAMFDGQTSSSTSNCALIPDLALPRRSLGSALPAASTGVPFFPPAAAISPQLPLKSCQDLCGTLGHHSHAASYVYQRRGLDEN
ncbi:hypothetical protein DPX16_20008 [Anabarilius grahami]|uniref:Uncharacterized protein n=1 Tax=Anabarilius grahami TaxID=495550 RepID=A0A3N0XPE1_ANAGA|nr:hypothetical protein DPX16_20008 [Anabarilius grahami]